MKFKITAKHIKTKILWEFIEYAEGIEHAFQNFIDNNPKWEVINIT